LFSATSIGSLQNPGDPSPVIGPPLNPAPGAALDRLLPLQASMPLATTADPFQQLAAGQQVLLQLMGLLLILMQNRSQPQTTGDSNPVNSVSGTNNGASSSAAGQGPSSNDAAPKGNGSTVTRQGKPIGAHIAKQFDAMVAAAKQDGVNITITSGFRTRAEQEKLYAAYKNGTGNLAAKPGTSNHESGDALDLGPPSAYSWLKQNAGRFGFKNTVAGEPWHWSLTGG